MESDSLLMMIWSEQQRGAADSRESMRKLHERMDRHDHMVRAIHKELRDMRAARRKLLIGTAKIISTHWHAIAIIALFVIGVMGWLPAETIAKLKGLIN